MNKVDQRVFGPGGVGKDCWKTCIASLLEFLYENVPELYGEDTMDQMALTRDFLWAHDLVMKSGTVSDLKNVPVTYFIGCGKSPRSTNTEIIWHAVICDLDEDGLLRIVHDPHPSKEGLLGDPTYFYWIVTAEYEQANQ